ncbi:MAG TPA: maleylpyruvate isomerase family mycothiol-dependent enzyme [Acidimicrobiales bacterium]|nr:maleylpyruvate isomerase family mycothiol-dependent enzyme [Acidimicrobiales bacterium]
MEVADLITVIRDQGNMLATAAEKAGVDAAVPTCPEWCMRDLVRHQGEVHRWATVIVRDGLSKPDVAPPPWPEDDQLVSWFREGYDALADVLERADPSLECFAFLPAPSPLAFWARRQAHETGIHRVDAESAVGVRTPFGRDVAVDGIEEMLFGFASRSRSRLRSPTPRSLAVRTTDTESSWVVHVDPESVTVISGEGDADCTVAADASSLFMLLWNRTDRSDVDVAGDGAVLDLWHDTMQIRWS